MLSEVFDHKTYLVPDNSFDNISAMKKQTINNNVGGRFKINFCFLLIMSSIEAQCMMT